MRFLQGYREVLQSLDLTQEQKGKTQDLIRGAMQDIRETSQDTEPQERLAHARERIEKLNADIRETLTDEQKARFDTGIKELQDHVRNPSTRPSTRPAGRALGGAGAGVGAMPGRQLQNFREAVESLDLTQEQEQQVAAAFDEAKEKMKDAEPGSLAGVVQELREKLSGVLTPEQREALQKKMQELRNRGPGADRPGLREKARGERNKAGGSERTPPPPASTPKNDAGGDGGDGFKPLDAGPPRGDAGSPSSPLVAGQPAPELSAMKLDGTPVRLYSYKNRNLVLVFGSLSSPTFREKAKLLNDLVRDFRSRVEFLVVYTAEAYPVGKPEVERNKDDKIRIEPHANLADRQRLAKQAKSTLNLDVLVVTDDMEDHTARAYDAAPNGAVVIGRNGTVFTKQRWLEPFALRRALEELTRPVTRPATE